MTFHSKLDVGGRYEVLTMVTGYFGGPQIKIGTPSKCRFCGEDRPSSFRAVAHTFPEGLGNRWITSLDECDTCNALFSVYDDALTSALSPLLTLGGVMGKGNKVRQTGRSAGASTIRHSRQSGRRQLSIIGDATSNYSRMTVDPTTGVWRFHLPVANVPFRPRLAYKSLCKMALAIMPHDELRHFSQLLTWLQTPNDALDFPILEIGLSTGSIGNAPPVTSGVLLRRNDPSDRVPYMVFLFCSGSACLQLDLMSDELDEHIPAAPLGCCDIQWTSHFSGGDNDPIEISYSQPVHLNWANHATQPQPIGAIELQYCPATHRAHMRSIMRP